MTPSLEVAAGIDHDGPLRGRIHHDGAVAAEGTRGERLEVHDAPRTIALASLLEMTAR